MKEVVMERVEKPLFQTQFSHKIDYECEQCGKFPSLTDPEAEVYTVGELIARHEKGLLTNMNIGMQAAYPKFVHLDDQDMEKIMGMDATDKFHLANELENDPEYVKLRKEAADKYEADLKAEEDAKFAARAAAEGYVKPDTKGDEGKT